ncbi:MAG: serine/threonine protein kinase [Capsulimonadaceae bacterium]
MSATVGKYRIIREITRSKYCVVYEGVEDAARPVLARHVAIKEFLLPPNLAESRAREIISQFQREAVIGKLAHPHIMTIHGVHEESGRYFIVTEYLEGHSLRDHQQMIGTIPAIESTEIAIQICDALGYAHARGIVHHNVQPDHVQLMPRGIVKLMGFGVVRIVDGPTLAADAGLLCYMSPEQLSSKPVDHRTDIFSLGATLYEMLTGRKAFVGNSVSALTDHILNVQPRMPQRIPPGLQAILRKALAKDVNDRYRNTAEMAADLRAERLSVRRNR